MFELWAGKYYLKVLLEFYCSSFPGLIYTSFSCLRCYIHPNIDVVDYEYIWEPEALKITKNIMTQEGCGSTKKNEAFSGWQKHLFIWLPSFSRPPWFDKIFGSQQKQDWSKNPVRMKLQMRWNLHSNNCDACEPLSDSQNEGLVLKLNKIFEKGCFQYLKV